MGLKVSDLRDKYIDIIPKIMSPCFRKKRSTQLEKNLKKIFGNIKFSDIDCNLGIITSNMDTKKPVIFKSKTQQVHDTKSSFIPGFGVNIYEAVHASCSAYPFFKIKQLSTKDERGVLNLIDGGYVTNNPSIISYIDAMSSLESGSNTKILNIGTGNFLEKTPIKQGLELLFHIGSKNLINTIFNLSANSQELYVKLLSKKTTYLRVNKTYNDSKLKTNLFESDTKKLEQMFNLGRETYRDYESQIKLFLD